MTAPFSKGRNRLKDGLPALAHEGDVVLLAPACSSYDQYPNYLRRGEDFKRVVREVLA